jgi:hypothetical protein
MSTTINSTISIPHESIRSFQLRINRFLDWSSDQQENRLRWEGISLIGFGCFFTPLTVLLISLSGANLFLIMTALIAMEAILVANLTAMPTKITIPAFFLAAAADIAISVVSVFKVI